jgi:hypothetical protein
MPRSCKRPRLTEAKRDARRQADRERVEQAARALADHRRLAALDQGPRQQRPLRATASETSC